MKAKTIGSWMILVGLASLLVVIYLFPPSGLPGSYNAPMSPMRFEINPQMMLTAQTNTNVEKSYYIEIDNSLLPQSTDKSIVPMTFKQGTQYKQSYVYKDKLTYSDLSSLSSKKGVIGIWEVPTEIPDTLLSSSPTLPYSGNLSIAMEYSGASTLINEGYAGQKVIVAILDDFPPSSYFYEKLPALESRVIHYPSNTNDAGDHGIMTASIVADVSPSCLLYLDDIYYDEDGDGYPDVNVIQCYQDIINLKQQYPGYQIVSSNSYTHDPRIGVSYWSPDHPENRKVLEMTENGIAVIFGVGNWAHQGEHDSKWTFDSGYDSRSSWFTRDAEIGYPAVYNEVISVAGSDAYCNKIISYSSLGRGVDGNKEPDVSAPTQFYYPNSPFYGGLAVGTSAACPFMAGICADILSGKTYETDRLVGSIHTYSTDKGNSGFDDEFGFGVADSKNIFDNYDDWVKPIEQSLDVSMYVASVGLLATGIVIYNKNNILDIVGG